MIRSMTGYGAAEKTVGGKYIRVEIKSVNHRYLEFSARVPRAYGFLEEKMKGLLSECISRGKVDCSVFVQTIEGGSEKVCINKDLAKSYIEALRSVRHDLDLRDDLSLNSVARLPDVFTVVQEEEDEDAVWTLVKEVADAAIENFIAMRGVEGEKMKADMLIKAAEIEERIGYVESRSPETVKEYQDRLYAKLQEVLQGAGIDENRILTEAAIYADKVAVDEETVRLRSHIAQFRDILGKGGAVGKKLDFLVQEMNREANTTGSKCSDADITRAVVDIKCDIEKIREQIQNIE